MAAVAGSALVMFVVTFAVAWHVEIGVIVDTCGPRQELRHLRSFEFCAVKDLVDKVDSPRPLVKSDLDVVPEGISATPVPQNYLWRQPYKYEVKSELVDFWGHPYEVRPYKKTVEFISFGRDGKPGGQGLDTDISNRSEIDRVTFQPSSADFMELANFGRMTTIALLAALAAGVAVHAGFNRNQSTKQLLVRGAIVAASITCMMAILFTALIAALYFVPSYGH